MVVLAKQNKPIPLLPNNHCGSPLPVIMTTTRSPWGTPYAAKKCTSPDPAAIIGPAPPLHRTNLLRGWSQPQALQLTDLTWTMACSSICSTI